MNDKPKERKIAVNAIRCVHCNSVPMSVDVHHFEWCECHKVAVDGGREYLKRVGNREDYIELARFTDRKGV